MALPNPTLPRADTYLENRDDFAHIDVLWLATFVDIFNTAMQDIENDLSSINARLIAGGL